MRRRKSKSKSKNVDLVKVFAANLAREREARELSFRALGGRAGLSGAYVWQVEAGVRKPSLTAMMKLSEAVEVPTSEMLKEIKK